MTFNPDEVTHRFRTLLGKLGGFEFKAYQGRLIDLVLSDQLARHRLPGFSPKFLWTLPRQFRYPH